MINPTVTVKVHVDMTEIEEYTRKVELLNDKLKEAKSLADEIASSDLNLNVTYQNETFGDNKDTQ